MNTQGIQKVITFPQDLYGKIEKKARKLGISFPEYMRDLASRDVKNEQEPIEFVDEETEKAIGRALEDYKKGRYTILKTDKDIEEHFKNL